MPIDPDALRHFTGTMAYTRWSPLFPNICLTDGTKYIADNGGNGGAYWLMDAIASYQPELLQNEQTRYFQLWTLKVDLEKSSAVLTCQQDSDEEPEVTQEIEYTDFDLPEINLYVMPLTEDKWVIMFPREY